MSERQKPAGFQIIAHEKTFFKVLDLLEKLPRGKVLDLPSGEGALSYSLAKIGFQVTAGDIDPRFFKADGIECMKIDMNHDIPLANETFEYIVCLEGIEHLQDPFQFIRECHRVLKWKGRLIFSTPNILNLASRLKFFFSGFYSLCPRPINEFTHLPVFDHINPMTYYQVRYALHSTGFRIHQTTTDLWRRSSLPFLMFYPLLRLYSIRTMRKETDARQRDVNQEVRRIMNHPDLLLGRSLIIEAQKVANPGIKVVDASDV